MKLETIRQLPRLLSWSREKMSNELVLELFEELNEQVFGFLVKMTGSRSDAEDLLQQTFLQALSGAVNYRPQGQARAWIFRIARNLLIDRGRRQHKWPLADLSESTAVLQSQELRAMLNQAVTELPAKEREAFLLCAIGGLSYLEISEVCDVSLSAVRSRIYRARLELRKALKPRRDGRRLSSTKRLREEETL